ncbi:DUF3800 domain-containing protein [Bifidobacterium sp. SO1]|uniref:DUF3800 domain-containing protein n=1 Tax=Bifidobacterium sp. SO1 TaxID=2809029 RepID=UPI001BDD3E41|nr:DUF3800 domain-containing protein [Bifidobacterium sp. SO1]MBT1161465.1 DUF3800 domain-containing protein [Bifidobacterium sp. SO1]
MKEISVFLDESGEQGMQSAYYLLTLVFHDQSNDIQVPLSQYDDAIRSRSLPDIPLHLSPLLNGHDDYAGLPVGDRKQLLIAFLVMLQRLPITYTTFAYRKRDFASTEALRVRMGRDITRFLLDNLSTFRNYDQVKVYYDSGQAIVSRAIHGAIEFVLFKDAVLYRKSSPQDYRLEQAADFICGMELTSIKFDMNEATATDLRFFQSRKQFRKNYLSKIRRLKMK